MVIQLNSFRFSVELRDAFGKLHATMDNRTGRDLRNHFK